MQRAAGIGFAECVKALFLLAVPGVTAQKKRRIEKYLLGLRLTYIVLIRAFARVFRGDLKG